MKKILLILLASLMTLAVYSQNRNYDNNSHYYDGVEYHDDLGITADQKNKIIQIKKGIGRRYAAIGQDRSLSGYEKGQKKRELSIQIRKEIHSVLNSNQNTSWDKLHSEYNGSDTDYNYNYNNSNGDINDRIDRIEDQIDDLEYQYNKDVKAVERNRSLSKYQIKDKKQLLKDNYKTEKEKLKREKENLKDSRNRY